MANNVGGDESNTRLYIDQTTKLTLNEAYHQYEGGEHCQLPINIGKPEILVTRMFPSDTRQFRIIKYSYPPILCQLGSNITAR